MLGVVAIPTGKFRGFDVVWKVGHSVQCKEGCPRKTLFDVTITVLL